MQIVIWPNKQNLSVFQWYSITSVKDQGGFYKICGLTIYMHILTNVTNFQAKGTRFPDNSQLLPVETVHSSFGTCFSANPSSRGNEFFVYWKQYCFIPSFFCQWKLLLKFVGSQFLKMKYSWWKPIFSIFSEILGFFKVEATFPYSGNAFFNKSFIQLVETDFLSSGNSVFWSELFFC